MSLQSLFNDFVRALGEQLAGYGFERGKGRVFRRYSPAGDALITELQMSDHSTKAEKLFYINVALVLAPKWESDRQRYRLPESELPRELHGTWRHRIGLTTLSGGDQWRIADEATAAEVANQALRRVDETVPQLLPLLDRNHLLNEADQLLGAGAWRVRAWLLAEQGPSKELEQLLFPDSSASSHSSVAKKLIWDYAKGKAIPASTQER